MKKIVALLLVISLGYSIAYCSDGDAHPFKRVYIGISVTPAVSYRYLVNNYVAPGSSSSINQNIIASDNHQAAPQFGLNAQAKLGINLTHWLAIESGVGYMMAQYRMERTQPLTFGSQFNGTTVTSTNDVLTVKERETYSYMTIPLGLRFSMGHRKVRGIIAAGTDFDFLVKKKQVTTSYDSNGEISSSTATIDQTKNFNTFNLSPYFGIGVDCYASPGIVIRLMPEAQIQALKNINTPISEYLWNVGFNVSLLFGL